MLSFNHETKKEKTLNEKMNEYEKQELKIQIYVKIIFIWLIFLTAISVPKILTLLHIGL